VKHLSSDFKQNKTTAGKTLGLQGIAELGRRVKRRQYQALITKTDPTKPAKTVQRLMSLLFRNTKTLSNPVTDTLTTTANRNKTH